MILDRNGNYTHLQVRKSTVSLHNDGVLDVWACMDCEQRFESVDIPITASVDKARRGIIDSKNTVSLYRGRGILSVEIKKEQWYWTRSSRAEVWLNAKTYSGVLDLIDAERDGERDKAAPAPDEAHPPG